MLDFLKRLFGLSTKQEPVTQAPYKVEVAPAAAPIAPVVEAAPVVEEKPAAPAITATKKKAEP